MFLCNKDYRKKEKKLLHLSKHEEEARRNDEYHQEGVGPKLHKAHYKYIDA